MSRTLLAAGILRDFEFGSVGDFYIYLKRLDHNQVKYRVIETFERSDGSFLARVLQQYNAVDLIEI